MAIKAICTINEEGTIFLPNGTTIQIDVTIRGFQGATLRTTVQGDRTTITPANVLAGLKNLLITAIQTHYGATLVASEILVIGAPQ